MHGFVKYLYTLKNMRLLAWDLQLIWRLSWEKHEQFEKILKSANTWEFRSALTSHARSRCVPHHLQVYKPYYISHWLIIIDWLFFLMLKNPFLNFKEDLTMYFLGLLPVPESTIAIICLYSGYSLGYPEYSFMCNPPLIILLAFHWLS